MIALTPRCTRLPHGRDIADTKLWGLSFSGPQRPRLFLAIPKRPRTNDIGSIFWLNKSIVERQRLL